MQPDLNELCAEIRAHHRRRHFAMEQRKRNDLALLSFLRTQLGWTKDLGKSAEGKRIAELAKALVDTAERLTADEATQKRQKVKPEIVPEYEEWRALIEGTVRARAPFDAMERAATKEMERLAAQLPVWKSWGEAVRGFSARSLAVIVGEAGNLDNYATHSKLWKRMGVAVIGPGDGLSDHRQGSPGAGATNADWIAEGYNKARRSRMHVIGDAFVKTKPGSGAHYRDVYDARKAYEVERASLMGLTVAPAAAIPKKRAAEFRSVGHIDLRARRYMEKRLLRDLWRAWRGGGRKPFADEAKPEVPPPEPADYSDEMTQAQVDALRQHAPQDESKMGSLVHELAL